MRQNQSKDALVWNSPRPTGGQLIQTVKTTALLDELGRRQAEVTPELAAKEGGMAVTQLKGHFLDRIRLAQEDISSDHPLFIEPMLRGAGESLLREALQLPEGDAAVCGHIRRVELGLTGKPQPGSLASETFSLG